MEKGVSQTWTCQIMYNPECPRKVDLQLSASYQIDKRRTRTLTTEW